ncbi:MAG: T6SS immunity protein Tli4 family protein [Betaproteobacteria bacterium]|nr:T6SS immunity protein Tli4 family protein [Betaproteobacteria bacterium]
MNRLLSLGFVLTLAACGNNDSHIAPVAALDYQTPAGWKTECMGYHLVDLPPGEIEAATEPVDSNSWIVIGGGEFTETLGVMNDGFENGEASVEISHPTQRDQFERYIPRKLEIILGRPYEPVEIQRARRDIETYKGMVEDRIKIIEKQKADPKPRDPNGPPLVTEENVQRWRDKIKETETYIAAWEASPDGAWLDDNTYYYGGWLWLWREPRIFRIRLNDVAIPEGKTRREMTLAFASRFQTRQLGEIPNEPGYCVPYGFIRGISTIPYSSQTTLRLKEEPGVLYTVRIQTDREAGGPLPYADPQGVKPQKIREKAKIGSRETELSGWHSAPYKEEPLPGGHFRVQRFKDGKPDWRERDASQGEIYQFAAGIPGEENNPQRPRINALMSSFAFDADPQMQDRPALPVDQALPAFKQLMNSIRLREENAQAFGAGKP